MRYGLFERPHPPRRQSRDSSPSPSRGGGGHADDDDDASSERQHHLNLLVMEVVGKLIRSLSSLLESKVFPAWRDLPYGERKRTLWRFIKAAEDLGSVIPSMTRLPIPEGATITSDNICKLKNFLAHKSHGQDEFMFRNVQSTLVRGKTLIHILIFLLARPHEGQKGKGCFLIKSLHQTIFRFCGEINLAVWS